MITELMIILIVVGAIIIFVAWTSARKRKRDEDDRRDAEDSTEKFKHDLEKTANEIIGRMETQAANLEKLLNDSERNRTQIEGRINELKKLLRKCEVQSADMKNLLDKLDDVIDEMDRRQIDKRPARISETKSPPPPIQNLIAPSPIIQPSQEFAKVLEQSMTEKPAPARKISEMPAMVAPAANSEQNETVNAADSETVREMLRAGMTVEEIAKETGLGRGAILLVQQMTRRKIDRR